MMIDRQDYSFLFDPPKDSDVFTRTLYYPRSPSSPTDSSATTTQHPSSSTATITHIHHPTSSQDDVPTVPSSSLGDNRHAATLSKFTTGIFSSTSAAVETVAPFLNSHIPEQVHIPDRRMNDDNNLRNKVYCYRHQPDLRCQRRTPQEDTMAEIQMVTFVLEN